MRLIMTQRRPRGGRAKTRRPAAPAAADVSQPGPHWAWRYVAAAAFVAAAVTANGAAPELIGRPMPFFVFFPAVMLAGLVGGFGPGVAATAASAAAAAYMNLGPQDSVLVPDYYDRLRLGLFLITGLGLSGVSHLLHTAVRRTRAAEEALALRARQQKLLIDAMPALVSYIDRDYRYVFTNKAYRDWFGIDPAQAEGRTMAEILGEETFARIKPRVEEAMAGRPALYAGWAPYRSGGGRWIEARYVPDLGPDGRARGAVALVLDVSERKAAERAARESDTRYRSLFASLEEGFCIIEVLFDDGDRPYDFKFLEINPAFERQSGIADAAGKTIKELRPDLDETWIKIYGRVAKTGKPERFVQEARQLGRWYEVHAWREGAPQRRRVAILFSDVTEHKRAQEIERARQEELARAEGRLRTIMDAMPALISYIDRDERYVFNNKAYFDWFGRTPEQLRGTTVADLIGPKRYAQVKDALRGALEGRAGTVDGLIEHPAAGRRWIHAQFVPDRDPAGAVRGAFIFVADVTRERTYTAELERAVAERTGELEAFSYTVSHDLRSPLRTILSFAELAARQQGLPAEAAGYIERILKAGRRMNALMQDLLALGRVSRGAVRLGTVDLDALAARVIEQYAGERRGAVTVEGKLGRVVGQEALLIQALGNLLTNALKFVPEGRAPRVRVFAERKDGRARLSVADNGIGISPEHVPKLFAPFVRLHHSSEYEGTGIGLATVKRAAQRMNGRVGVESVPGEGSTFWIELDAA